MIQSGLKLDRSRHLVLDNHPIAKAARRALQEPCLTCIFHCDTRRFNIAAWRNRQAGVVQELPLGFYHETHVTRKMLDDLRFVCSPWQRTKLMEQAAEGYVADKRFLDERLDREAQERDRMASWKRTNARKFGSVKAEKIDAHYKFTTHMGGF